MRITPLTWEEDSDHFLMCFLCSIEPGIELILLVSGKFKLEASHIQDGSSKVDFEVDKSPGFLLPVDVLLDIFQGSGKKFDPVFRALFKSREIVFLECALHQLGEPGRGRLVDFDPVVDFLFLLQRAFLGRRQELLRQGDSSDRAV